MADRLVGIDIGGTGVKGGLVDVVAGALVGDRRTLETPKPSTPDAVFDVVVELVSQLAADAAAPVGVTVPSIVKHGFVESAANVDATWVGVDAKAELEKRLGRAVRVVNDADAAGYAEMAFGAAQDREGVVFMTTLGTGIGTAIIYHGLLVPNVEMGVVELDGHVAEQWAGNAARERDGLSWSDWAARLTRYYTYLDRLFSPDLFVVGGGVSASWSEFGHLVDCNVELVPAALGNSAGVIGAALLAHRDVAG